jgi:hypothetical protein
MSNSASLMPYDKRRIFARPCAVTSGFCLKNYELSRVRCLDFRTLRELRIELELRISETLEFLLAPGEG